MFRQSLLPLLALLAGFGIAGCKVGPNYRRPHADVSGSWLDSRSPATTQKVDDVRWWTTFNDPALSALVERALTQNLTLRQAGLRVIQARALRGIAVGQFFPQSQAAVGEASNNQISKNSPQAFGDRAFRDYSVGLEAAWE